MAVSLAQEAIKLSPRERLELISEVWDSLQAQDVLLTEGQRRELDRRLEDHLRNPVDVVPWEEAKERLRRKLQ